MNTSINLPPVDPELQVRPERFEPQRPLPAPLKGYTARVEILIDGELDTHFAVTTVRADQLQEAVAGALNAWEI